MALLSIRSVFGKRLTENDLIDFKNDLIEVKHVVKSCSIRHRAWSAAKLCWNGVGVFVLAWLISLLALANAPTAAQAHDIYTGVHGRDGTLCCGGSDCARTQYRLMRNGAEFFVHEKEWVFIPNERITFLPIPGDSNGDGHFCGRPKTTSDVGEMSKNVFGNWYLYCAFIPPGYV